MSVRDRYWDLSPTEWTREEIRDYYDTTRVSLLTLAGMLGLTGSEVKEIMTQKKD